MQPVRFRSLKKSVFTSNHVDLELETALLQLPGALMPHVQAAVSWALTSSQIETFRNYCMRRMMGRYRGLGDPSTTELQDGTGQVSIT